MAASAKELKLYPNRLEFPRKIRAVGRFSRAGASPQAAVAGDALEPGQLERARRHELVVAQPARDQLPDGLRRIFVRGVVADRRPARHAVALARLDRPARDAHVRDAA